MDPRVLTPPPETTVAGAIALVRGAREHAAHILYVVDRLHRLAGVVSLKGLLAGEADEPVASLMEIARLLRDQVDCAASRLTSLSILTGSP